MSTTVSFNGQTYTIPDQGDSGAWGKLYKLFLQAVASGAISASGTATLSNKTLAAPVADTLHVTASSSAVGASGKTVLRHNNKLLQASIEGGAYQSVVQEPQATSALDHGAFNGAVNRADNSIVLVDGSVPDAAPAINAAIAAAAAAHTNYVYVPAGDYLLRSPIVLRKLRNFKFIGAGPQATRFYVYNECNNLDIIQVINCQNCEIGGFEISGRSYPFIAPTDSATIASAVSGSTALPVPKSGIACLFDYGTGSSGANPYVTVPNNNYFHDIFINVNNGTDPGVAMYYGMRFDRVDPDGPDYGNSENLLERVVITSCYQACVYFNGSQCKMNILRDCLIGGTSTRGLWCELGNFHFMGGTCTAKGTAFILGAPNDAVVITGCSSEGMEHWIDASVAYTRSSWSLTLIGNRVDCSLLHSDNVLATFYQLGPTIIEGNEIFGIQSAARSPLIKFKNSNNADNIVKFENNAILGPKSPLFDMAGDGFDNPAGLTDRGNSYFDLDGSIIGQQGSFRRVESGEFTISDAATSSGTVAFLVDTHDTKYRVLLSVVGTSGTPASGAWRTKVTRNKANFSVTLDAAPGTGNSITYAWKMERG